MSGFTLQWSRTIPPSATVPCTPVPFFASSVHRPRFASSSRFGIGQAFFYSIDSPCRPRAGVAPPICCTMHVHPRVHKVRRLDWTGLDRTIWVHDSPKRSSSNVPWSNVLQCNGKRRWILRDQSRVLNFISIARSNAQERFCILV